MMRYAQLGAADPDMWQRCGAAWRGLDATVADRAAGLTACDGGLRSAWSGAAADAAGARLVGLRAELTSVGPALIEVDQILGEFAARLRGAHARLADTLRRIHEAGLRVEPDGRVTTGAAAHLSAGRHAAQAARLSADIAAALDLAQAADRDASDRLAALAVAARTAWVEPPPAYRPPVGATAARVRTWWAGLTPAQRRWLVGREPALIGRLDGIPAGARDQANRLLLDDHRELLLARRREVLRQLPPGPLQLAGLSHVDGSLAGLAALTDRLAGAPGTARAYLLRLDPAGDGRAVVAVGDPDRADAVLTYVPGMTADLADATSELDRAAQVAARCAALAPGRETAAVLWLDYDAPDHLAEASRDRQAEEAAAGLHQFQEGLRLTHDGPPARHTVLGHSYGSLVVGTAAREHGLATDALVFVGSPGVGVDHAAQLRLPQDEVWASTAADDVIRLARPPVELAGRATVGVLPWLAGGLVGRPDDDLWFGRNPSDPSFGGRTFPSGRYGHTGYWHPDNPALDGMARIVLGR